jgi:hypothetical protein
MNAKNIMLLNSFLTIRAHATKMDVSTSINAAAMRGVAEAAERAHQGRADQQRAAAGHPTVDHGKGITHGRGRRVKAGESVDPTAIYEKAQRQDGKHLIDIRT